MGRRREWVCIGRRRTRSSGRRSAWRASALRTSALLSSPARSVLRSTCMPLRASTNWMIGTRARARKSRRLPALKPRICGTSGASVGVGSSERVALRRRSAPCDGPCGVSRRSMSDPGRDKLVAADPKRSSDPSAYTRRTADSTRPTVACLWCMSCFVGEAAEARLSIWRPTAAKARGRMAWRARCGSRRGR